MAHRPLIGYGLSWLRREGITEAAVCGNRETQVLQARLDRHVPDGLSVASLLRRDARGAAGSARDAAANSEAQTFVVAEGTAIPNVDLHELVEHHRASGAAVTVVVHPESRGQGKPVLHVPNGIYLFEREAFELVPATGFCDIKEELIPRLHAAGRRVVPFEVSSDTPRVLDSATYMAVNERMIEELTAAELERPGYLRTAHGLVHRDAFVAPDAMLVGPVLIGPGAYIGAGAVVVGPTSLGREVVLEANATVSRCAVWRRATIGEGARIERCIVADDAVIDAGTQAFKEVLHTPSAAEVDWVTEPQAPPRRAPRTTSLDVGGLISRFVFGTGLSRSPTVQ